MFKHAYILYVKDNPDSVQYATECSVSCSSHGLIPHLVDGHTNLSYSDVCKKYRLRSHPWCLDKKWEDTPGAIDRTTRVDAGHFDIWKMIIESGEPGIVLEHDTIVKGNIDVEARDGEIIHFGPRILNIDDYDYPDTDEQKLIPIEKWEGVHAYGITPGTAQQLLDHLAEHGYVDTMDPMLAFRNTFDLKMYTVDPPPIVVVNGGRKSHLNHDGVAAFWNAYHTPGFLANMKPGAQIAPLRQLALYDRSFEVHRSALDSIFKPIGQRKNDVLVVNSRDGFEAMGIGNRLLYHDDSNMTVTTTEQDAQRVKYNLYFCWHYTKVNVAILNNSSNELRSAVKDSDLRYDAIYYRARGALENILADMIFCWNILREGGTLILEGVNTEAKINFIKAVNASLTYGGDNLVVYEK